MTTRDILSQADEVPVDGDLGHCVECFVAVVVVTLLNCLVMNPLQMGQAIRNLAPAFRRVIKRWHAANPRPECP